MPFYVFACRIAGLGGKVIDEKRLEETLVAALRKHGHSVTSQRVTIFRALAKRRDHPTAEALHEQLANQGNAELSLATVYKNLHLFESIGVARAVATPDGRARFDVPLVPHHHLYCTGCGAVVDVEDGVEVALAPHLEQETGFRVTGAEVVLEGLCLACQQAKPPSRGFRRSSGRRKKRLPA